MLSIPLLALSSGAVPAEEWNKTFAGASNTSATAVLQTADGSFIFAGDTCSNQWCIPWLVRTDALGNEQWNMTLGREQNSEAHSIQRTKDGGYIIAGRTYSNAGGSYAWLIKVRRDANGTAKTSAASPTEIPTIISTHPVPIFSVLYGHI